MRPDLPTMSPRKRYRLAQQAGGASCGVSPSSSSSAAILSPREPRTLCDMMQSASHDQVDVNEPTSAPTTDAFSDTDKIAPPVNVALQPSPEPLRSPTDTTPTVAHRYSSPPRKSVIVDRLPMPAHAEPILSCSANGLFMNYMSPTIRSLNLGQQQGEFTRSVSLVEDMRHQNWNGHEDYGVDPVHSAVKQDPCGDTEYAPVTPPLKKKV